jgi:hypothetical protein
VPKAEISQQIIMATMTLANGFLNTGRSRLGEGSCYFGFCGTQQMNFSVPVPVFLIWWRS